MRTVASRSPFLTVLPSLKEISIRRPETGLATRALLSGSETGVAERLAQRGARLFQQLLGGYVGGHVEQ